MQNLTTKLLMAAALVAVAGCSKKPPAQLPPAPPTESTPAPETTQPEGPVASTVVPGSKEDFLQQVGSDRVFFGTDKYDLDSEARAILDRQADWLAKYPNVRVTVEGHCDERGTREYNLALGDRRANSAKNYLATKIDASRISTVSYGKERPAVEGSDESAWAQNRRAVSVVITGM
ncbi:MULTISPECIES: peptidoglycan-associated lipoprotein Pal [Sphingomonadales]|uniref:Peptidoglycan-associated lipoprotein n=2 Tax=Edaphosphingomonas TaxID=3423724 RepID=A0A2T4I7K2_9SPHN|nr:MULTISPECIES: peptidoglycan-associated lipoprotein Pal [Sphingomonas]AGH50123.1 peptidoglycan-associated lipoprotein [Sphingomonas sp. MM-1]MDX3883015.1 peptidoglycan-associated lipoprotein Pal [Sphingomonas sp.]OHT18482.1 Outer membrane lipoprotein Omp16 precursor [Sphingomonas haloaromaticamans]PTD27152.1 peptidoglycan-associated lipoprotein [Sphingomonas fennica]